MATIAASVKNSPVRKATARATSKKAATQASRSGKGKPAPALYAAVAGMPTNA
jgi:hypothetical protein